MNLKKVCWKNHFGAWLYCGDTYYWFVLENGIIWVETLLSIMMNLGDYNVAITSLPTNTILHLSFYEHSFTLPNYTRPSKNSHLQKISLSINHNANINKATLSKSKKFMNWCKSSEVEKYFAYY